MDIDNTFSTAASVDYIRMKGLKVPSNTEKRYDRLETSKKGKKYLYGWVAERSNRAKYSLQDLFEGRRGK